MMVSLYTESFLKSKCNGIFFEVILKKKQTKVHHVKTAELVTHYLLPPSLILISLLFSNTLNIWDLSTDTY